MKTVKEFLSGILLACQYLIIDVDQPGFAIEIMQTSGFSKEEFLKIQKETQYFSRRINKVIREAFPD